MRGLVAHSQGAVSQAAAGLRDQLDGSAQCDRRQALTAKTALDQVALDETRHSAWLRVAGTPVAL